MRTIVLGDINTNKQALEKQVKAKTEKLVKFFGEEYRTSIEKKIEKTLFVVTERNYLSSQQDMAALIKIFLSSGMGNFIEYLPIDDAEKSNLYNDKYVLNIINNLLKEENFDVKNNIEFRAMMIADVRNHWILYGMRQKPDDWIKENFNNPDYIKQLEKCVKKIGIDAIKHTLKASLILWNKDTKKMYEASKKQFYESYFSALKLKLNDNEILCAKELEKQFGKRVREIVLNESCFMNNTNIAQVYLDFFRINQELMQDCDVEMFAKMFELLTGEKKEFEEYLKDEALMSKIDKINQNLGKKLSKRKQNSKTSENLQTVRKHFEEEHIVDMDQYLEELENFIEFKIGCEAYFSPSKKSNGEVHHLIALPKHSAISITHEMIHSAFQSENDRNMTGVANFPNYRGLNEVLTEYFTCLIEDDSSYKFRSTHFNNYSAAFPLLKDFLKENLDVLKRCYANNSLKELEDLIGKENLDKLSEKLDALLYTEPTESFTATKVKTALRKKEKIPAIEDLKNLMNEIEENLSV